jgi:hypothetical protein
VANAVATVSGKMSILKEKNRLIALKEILSM